ncbi:MAG: signal peptide peptidase SppA [Gammaproteobacteria bacterium]|jgi:protease-4|nr:signal peptide peptidase SppA [Gammaproteobacteria bacterium]|tara:strand:+ start:14486 stop:16339 length:1854 start_codon:yes stop_codon:yes gene_type:complete
MSDQPDKPGLFSRIGAWLTRIRLILSNLIFFTLLAVFLVIAFSGVPVPQVPERAALVLDPRGAIVEARSPVDPIQQWLAPQAVLAETELTELLDALAHAADDERIPMVVLDLDDLQFLSIAHANAIGDALQRLRDAGKQVVAYGSGYAQQTYLVASHADAVYMHPLGQVLLPGYGIRNLYFKGLLDELKINVHVFRAGRYKEFVEPWTRQDMSPEAREANGELVDALWAQYGDRVMQNRRLEAGRFQRYTNDYADAVTETDGDFARLAVEYHLVDELLTPDQARARVADAVGYADDGGFNGIGFRSYLEAVDGEPQARGSGPQVGVITGQGPIVMGSQVGGVIAAERMIQVIRRAREDADVRALVVRLDSPGGSAFASELIRQELELTQLAGKPVVVSMGPVAASGGYWISSTADEIFAEPSTITGSIGVFGILPTFEDSLAGIGVTSDGVETTPLSTMDPFTGLNDSARQVFQTGTERTYERFTHLVARGRDLSLERVAEIAEGRVWIGSRAAEIGLVDTLGGRQAAIARAAELAGLEDYGVKPLAPPLSPRELLLRQLTGNAWTDGMARWLWNDGGAGTAAPLVRRLRETWDLVERLNDPQHSYALCLTCRIAAP